MNIAEVFGRRMQKIRKVKHLTQEELAFRMNKSTRFISDLERGARKPNLNTLLDLINSLEITPNELFCDILPKNDEIAEAAYYIYNMYSENRAFILKIVNDYYNHVATKP